MKKYTKSELQIFAKDLFKPKAQAKASTPKKPSRLKLAAARLLNKLKTK
jgi:hypothetical protein